MKLLFKLSFIPSGILLSCVLFSDIMQLPIGFMLLFSGFVYQLLYIFLFRVDDGLSFVDCVALWLLCLTVTAEIVIVANLLGMLNSPLIIEYFGHIGLTYSSDGIRIPDIALIGIFSIFYQIYYAVRKKR